jgi:hypothetical protein
MSSTSSVAASGYRAPVAVLRHFLYLDSQLVDQFLAQVEGGTFEEEAQRLRDTTGKERGGQAGASVAGAHAQVRAGRSSGQEEETARTVQQTPESRFARLYGLLDDQGAVQWLEAFDAAIWDQLQRGELVEVDTAVSVSTLVRYQQLVEQAGPLIELMQAVGESVDAETKAAMSLMGTFGQVMGNAIPIVARATGAPDFKFVASLTPAHVRTELDQIDGESTLLAKIQRKVGPEDRYTLFDSIPGVRGLPQKERKEIEADLSNSPEFPDMITEGPLAVVTPVAIYR